MPKRPVDEKVPDLDRVLARLDRIEAALVRLVTAVEGGAVMSAAAAPVGLETPAKAKAATATTAAAAVAVAGASAPAKRGGVPAATPPRGTIEGLLQAMFTAAMLEDPEGTFEALEQLTHPAELQAPRALDNLRAFSWKKLRTSYARYLTAEEPHAFHVVRTQPKDVGERVERVKVFLRSGTASPSPVTLVRDQRSGGAWRIKQISL